MSSKKDSDVRAELSDQEKIDSLPEDWSPDHFPTSAKPIFKKISILTAGILILCLFLAYCSQNDTEKGDATPEQKKAAGGSSENQDDESNEDEVF